MAPVAEPAPGETGVILDATHSGFAGSFANNFAASHP